MITPRTILITGATSGIGRHAALHLARAGHRVFATGRDVKALEVLKAEAPPSLETIVLDVTSAESIEAARVFVDDRTSGQGLDVLVNNAGYGAMGPTELITDADLRAQYETNVFGLMAVTRAFVAKMRRRGAGTIINVSSLGGRLTLPMMGVYNSTKYAVESLSDALRIELRPFGVRVALIEPGVIHTGFSDASMDHVAKYRAPDSPYAPVLARAEELRALTDRTAVGPACISRAIEKAATARSPRARYVAPWSAGLMIGFLRLLPTRWSDALLAWASGFTRKQFGRAVTTPQLTA
jgi:short-subunit dehydrogenase